MVLGKMCVAMGKIEKKNMVSNRTMSSKEVDLA